MIVTKFSLLRQLRTRYGYVIGICAFTFSTVIWYHVQGTSNAVGESLKVVDDHEPLFKESQHRKLYSLSTSDRKWFKIDWGNNFLAYNPSILPHPTKADSYIVTGLQVLLSEVILQNFELVCTATFANGALQCTAPPTALPVESVTGHCEDDLAVFNFRPGPRDARMFHGPDVPYLMYGSLATHNCLGLFLQDLRTLVDDYKHEVNELGYEQAFANGTEMQRPPPVADVQKNWFVFWDAHNEIYVHQDIHPSRAYQKLSIDGSVGLELSGQAQPNDKTCMAKLMPGSSDTNVKIHQATNSLSITMCKRSDPKCVPNDDNTFIMTLFHHQTFYDWHAQYYPHIMLFKRNSPFQVHAISQKSLWIYGKPLYTIDSDSLLKTGEWVPPGHTELFYMTSMNWKSHGSRYHGFMDDPLFITFGIEDTRSGGIDILGGDLLQDLAFCEDV